MARDAVRLAGPSILSLFCILFLNGCQTPERKVVLERMNRLQAENSALQARSDADVAQAKMQIVRQRQDDLQMFEQLNKRFDELSKKIDALNAQQRSEAPKLNLEKAPVAEPQKIEPAKPDSTVQAEIEAVKAQARAEMARIEEELAKAQAQAEAAKLAAAAAEKAPKDARKEGSFRGQKLPLTKFIDSSGKLIDVLQYTKEKTVVLCVMKGFYSQGVCVYCTRQTADLAKNSKAFKDLNTEVLVVYPGREEHINTFVRSVRDYEKSDDPRFQLPFKVLLDINQDAVRTLNIAGDLANPTTFILDKTGCVRYQYTGRTISDRPTAADMLEELKKIGDSKP
jgi:peroxiredoxin